MFIIQHNLHSFALLFSLKKIPLPLCPSLRLCVKLRFVFFEYADRIVTAETEGIAHGYVDGTLLRFT